MCTVTELAGNYIIDYTGVGDQEERKSNGMSKE